MAPQPPELSDRFPQWSHGETRELIAVRAELDRSFMETKRNRLLWDLVSNRMREKGFHRSPEQCKCKWKNLVTRYKGSETMEAGAGQQFPFQEELRAIFTARMQRLLWAEAESGGGSSSGAKKAAAEDEEGSAEEGQAEKGGGGRKRKVGRSCSSSGDRSSVYEMVEEFLKKQVRMEMEWCKEEEAREKERTARDSEWRRTMEALERERLMMERSWREREEQRRAREEARAERRDHLVTALLNKLLHGTL